jgi:hypothetical protein
MILPQLRDRMLEQVIDAAPNMTINRMRRQRGKIELSARKIYRIREIWSGIG